MKIEAQRLSSGAFLILFTILLGLTKACADLELIDLSTATSLTDEGQALFLANSDQPGVPAGRPYPDEVTNYQTFAKGDAIQIINHPTYSLEGDSYFEYLSL